MGPWGVRAEALWDQYRKVSLSSAAALHPRPHAASLKHVLTYVACFVWPQKTPRQGPRVKGVLMGRDGDDFRLIIRNMAYATSEDGLRDFLHGYDLADLRVSRETGPMQA
jgi:hypothetical protein